MSPLIALCRGCGREIPMGMRRGRCDTCRKQYERERSRLRHAAEGTALRVGAQLRIDPTELQTWLHGMPCLRHEGGRVRPCSRVIGDRGAPKIVEEPD